MAKVQIEGFEEFKKRLENIGEDVEEVMTKAVLEGTALIKDDANVMAPDPNIGIEVQDNFSLMDFISGDKTVTVAVGPIKRKWYYQFDETGTGEHPIKGKRIKDVYGDKTKKRNMLAIKSKDRSSILGFSKTVKHPGFAPHKFLQPAYDQQIEKAMERIGKVILSKIEENYEEK